MQQFGTDRYNLRTITLQTAMREYNTLRAMNLTELQQLSNRSRVGLRIIDYWFFNSRLNVVGNKKISFHEFVNNIEFYKSKRYINNLINYIKQKEKKSIDDNKMYYQIYTVCFGAANAFKVSNALTVYRKYNPKHILDFCAGFGGRCVAAMAADIDYTGIDTNTDLKPAFDNIVLTLPSKSVVRMIYQDAATVDYSAMHYDFVLTSPPYYNIEKYSHMAVKSKAGWNEWYRLVVRKIYDGLQPGGHFCLNINVEIFNVIKSLIGDPCESHLLKAANRLGYSEQIYVWVKR